MSASNLSHTHPPELLSPDNSKTQFAFPFFFSETVYVIGGWMEMASLSERWF